MRIAVIGAGIAGLTAARRLSLAGHTCDVYERWPGIGGQVATIDVGAGHLLERYYHHLFTSDLEIKALYEELGMGADLEWLPSSVAIFANGHSHPFTTPLDLLRFKLMSPAARLRMGLAVLLLQRRHREVEPFESQTAHEWIVQSMGKQAWTEVWGPLLNGKFGRSAEEISMAWLWSKLTVRRRLQGREARGELLGYPKGGWQPLLDRLASEIEACGRVLIDRPAARVILDDEGLAIVPGAPGSFRRGHDPRGFDAAGAPESYDCIVATTPSDVFLEMLDARASDAIGPDYLARVRASEYHAAACLLLEFDRQFSPFYWINVADPAVPFIGLIEQTNLIQPERYAGRHFLYVANYVEPDDPLLSLDVDELIAFYEPALRRVNGSFARDWVVQSWLFREPAAQPIVRVGHHERIPSLRTGVPGFYLANTTQIYPEDRGTNYSVRLGEDVAAALLEDAEARTGS